MRFRRLVAVTTILCACAATQAWAQDSTQDSEKTEQQERKTSRVVLTESDFVRLNCENVGDALKTITGVFVNSEGEVMLRDVSSNKVVVVMDGQKLNMAGGSSVNVSSISIENVKSIELLRGGRSAEFGADAVGGVIVINSKTSDGQAVGKKYSLNHRLGYGATNRQIMSTNFSMAVNPKLNYMVSFKKETADGDFEYTDNYGEKKDMVNNHEDSQNVFGKVGYRINPKQTLNASYSLYVADNGTPGMVDNLTPNARLRLNNGSTNVSYKNADLYCGMSLDIQSYYQNFRTRFDDIIKDQKKGDKKSHSDHKNYAYGLDIKQSGHLARNLTASYGYSFRQDEIESTSIASRDRDTHSAFMTASYGGETRFGPLSAYDLSVAARYDEPNDFDSELSPRVSLSLRSDGFFVTQLSGHVTKSYRAPTFNDLYWPRDSFAIGNPNLQPERGFNYDVGMNVSKAIGGNNFAAAVNYFANDVDDLIIWTQSGAGGLWTPQNISKTSTWGIESSYMMALFNNKYMANVEYTYMKALDKGPNPKKYNKFIIYRPEHKMSVTNTISLSDIEWSVVYTYMGERYAKEGNSLLLDGFGLLDTNINYGFKIDDMNMNAVLEFKNILDEDYQRTLGTAEPGRMYKLSLWMTI